MFMRNKQGAVHLIAGEDPLNIENIEVVEKLLRECLGGGQPRVVLDLQQVPLIDSAGLELLLNLQDVFSAQGGALKLAGSSPLCSEILSVTGVGRQLELYPEVSVAVRSFGQ